MLHLTKLRELNLHAATSPERPAFLSAASGLVRADKQLYVVADDELHLGMFTLDENTLGELLRLFTGELPDKQKQRKKQKPDLEVLTQLPPFTGYPHGVLLALGSGSTHRRYRGVLLQLNSQGQVHGAPRILDASALFAGLALHFAELNLEGAWVHDHKLHLLQRGNQGGSPNAVIQLDLPALLSGLLRSDVLPALTPLAIHTLQLGEINGVPLSFTDASALPDGRWLFSAVAEAADNAYDDGACVGAAIGMADANHQLLWLKQVSPTYKIEGIAAQLQANTIQLLCVTDADDPQVPARLLSASISLGTTIR